MAENEEVPSGIKLMMDEASQEDDKSTDETKSGDESSKEADATETKVEDEKADEKKADEEKPQGTPYQGKFKSISTVEQLEESFSNSFTEAKRLNDRIKELEAQLAAQGESDDKSDDDQKGTEANPEVEELKGQVTALSKKQLAEDEQQWNDFMSQHPEIEEDPILQERLDDAIMIIATKAKRADKFVSMADALNQAWSNYLEPFVNRNNSKQEKQDPELEGAAKMAAKELAAGEGPGGSKQPSNEKKPTLTEEERRTARAYGLTDEEYLANK